ncbi:alpha-glucoside transport system permease protein [Kaistia soli DSM 19436]|uniref:Alpha-glucoside transport system permease protein n=1 Tax=Kaistia soli DSM 19436 TaxID=1122133 RepID=A0A1M4YSW8_9HYPH|nr:sugar ABC transporter permease [Kaistia soli]SHF08919.1 alpha-glucoside transport system permease protein [Kaistia soli DSM 19436]
MSTYGRSSPSWLKLALTLASALLALLVLWQGFFFLRDTDLPRLLTAFIAILGFGAAMSVLYVATDVILQQLPLELSHRLQPLPFIVPGVVMVGYFVALPMVRTLAASLFNRDGTAFVGFANYIQVFTEPFMLETFRNNLLWLVFGAGLTVVFGLTIAALADRSRHEKIAKAIIFMPMAISLVGAGVIWKFIYAFKDPSEPQIGLLNAIVVAFGGEPQAWIQLIQPWNNLFLIVIVIWLQTGYAMVLFSAAIKSVPNDLLEAARIDGAGEIRIFFSIIIPYIRPTLIAVTATVVIFTLKIFDIVLVMTGGQFGTDVIATQFYNQYFVNRNAGLGSAIAIVLLAAVVPVIVYNLKNFNRNEPL